MLRAPDSTTPDDSAAPVDPPPGPDPPRAKLHAQPRVALGSLHPKRLTLLGHFGRLVVLLLLTALGATVVELGGWWGWPRSILIVLAAGITGALLGKLVGVPGRLTAYLVLLVAATISCMRWGEAWFGWPGLVVGGLAAYFVCHWVARVPLNFLGSFLLRDLVPEQFTNPNPETYGYQRASHQEAAIPDLGPPDSTQRRPSR